MLEGDLVGLDASPRPVPPQPRSSARPPPRSPRTPAGRNSGALRRLDAWLADRGLEDATPAGSTLLEERRLRVLDACSLARGLPPPNTRRSLRRGAPPPRRPAAWVSNAMLAGYHRGPPDPARRTGCRVVDSRAAPCRRAASTTSVPAEGRSPRSSASRPRRGAPRPRHRGCRARRPIGRTPTPQAAADGRRRSAAPNGRAWPVGPRLAGGPTVAGPAPGPGRLTPRASGREPNGRTLWYGAELNPDGRQVWFRITAEAVCRMREKTPLARGECLIDALLAWLTPDRGTEARAQPLRGPGLR